MGQDQAVFSVIIPTYNRPKQLAECLRVLADLDYPRGRFEVIVVNDGGESSPASIAGEFPLSLDLTFLNQPHLGPAGARNAGAEVARGEYLAFTDDDCRPGHGWLKAFAGRFIQEGNICAVGGRVVNGLPDNPCSTASQTLVQFLYDYYGAGLLGQFFFFATNNLAVPADRFSELSGFDSSFVTSAAEDREFCDRWQRAGYTLVYEPNAVVYHARDLTLGGFLRQHYGYGRGAYRFRRARAHRGGGRFRPDFRFYCYLLRYALNRPRRRRGLLTILLLLSQWAGAAGYLRESLARSGGRAD